MRQTSLAIPAICFWWMVGQHVSAQCQPNPSQGNAYLHAESETDPPGINTTGTVTTLHIAGTPLSPIILGASATGAGPISIGPGQLYLSLPVTVLLDGTGFPFLSTDANGNYAFDLVIPNDVALQGSTFFFQAGIGNGVSFDLSNGASVTVGGSEPIWNDGFEGYACDSFPSSEWTSWANGGVVDCTQAFAGSASFRAEGVSCGFFAGGPAHTLDTCQTFYVDFRVLLKDTGCTSVSSHGHKLFVIINDGPDSFGPRVDPIAFWEDGRIEATPGIGCNQDLGTWVLDTWHHVIIKYDRINATQVHYTYWIDGVEVYSTTCTAILPDEDNWNWVIFEAGDGPVWLDEIMLYR